MFRLQTTRFFKVFRLVY